MHVRSSAIFIICTALISGCAAIPGTESTVSDVESTDPTQRPSNLAPLMAAACVQKNVETSIATFFVASTTPRDSGVRMHLRSAVGTAALVDVEPSSQGSLLHVRISRHYLARGTLTDKLIVGC